MTSRPGAFPRPDFLADPDAPSAWPRWFAAGGAATLVLLGFVAWRMQGELDRIDGDRQAVVVPARMARNDTVSIARASSDVDSVIAAWRVDGALSHPWNDVFSSLESATPPGVSWLGFDHSANTGQLHLEGTSANIEDILATVDRFAQEPAWADVVLTGWERAAPAVGSTNASVLKFAVEARLASQASSRRAGQAEQ